MTPKEEQDLTRLMSDSELAISDAQRFAEKLSNDLNSLDGVSGKFTIKCLSNITLMLMQYFTSQRLKILLLFGIIRKIIITSYDAAQTLSAISNCIHKPMIVVYYNWPYYVFI